MTIVIVKPRKENAKLRKYLKQGAFIAKKKENRELARKISKAWAKLNPIELPVYKEEHSGSCLMPQVYILKAGHRKAQRKNKNLN